jgi:hypothetical protein
VFGGSATLDLSPSASVGRNLFYGGYSLTTQAGSKINTDLYGGMAQAIIKGDLGRDAILSANAVELSGKIGRNARLNVSEPGNNNNNNMSMSPFFQQSGMPPAISSGLRIAASSTIGGKLTYTSPMDQSQAIQNQPQGGIVFQTPVPDQNTNQAQAQRFNPAWNFFNGVLNLLRNLITLLILGALALWLLPGLFTNVVDHAAAKPLQASGYGLITVVVGFVGAFLAGLAILLVGIIFSLVTLGGLSSAWFGIGFSGLAVVFTAFVLLINYGSKLVVSYLVGRWLVSKIAPQSAGSKVWPLLVGVVVYVILRAIPILGWLIALVVTLVGMGAMWLAYTTRNNHAVVEAPQA